MDVPSPFVPRSKAKRLAIGSVILALVIRMQLLGYFMIWGIFIYPALCILHLVIHWHVGSKSAVVGKTAIWSHVLFVFGFLLQGDATDASEGLILDRALRGLTGINLSEVTFDPAPFGWNLGVFFPVAVTWGLLLWSTRKLEPIDNSEGISAWRKRRYQ